MALLALVLSIALGAVDLLVGVLQALAMRVQLRRGERGVLPGNAGLLVLALVVAVLRFLEPS